MTETKQSDEPAPPAKASLRTLTRSERLDRRTKLLGLCLSPLAILALYLLGQLIIRDDQIGKTIADTAFSYIGLCAAVMVMPAVAHALGAPRILTPLVLMPGLTALMKFGPQGLALTAKGFILFCGLSIAIYMVICEFLPTKIAVATAAAPEVPDLDPASELTGLRQIVRQSRDLWRPEDLEASPAVRFVFSRIRPEPDEQVIAFHDGNARTSFVLTNKQFHHFNNDVGGDRGSVELGRIAKCTVDSGIVLSTVHLTLVDGRSDEVGDIVGRTKAATLAEYINQNATNAHREIRHDESNPAAFDLFMESTHSAWGQGASDADSQESARVRTLSQFKHMHAKIATLITMADAHAPFEPGDFLVSFDPGSYFMTNRRIYLIHDGGISDSIRLQDIVKYKVRIFWTATAYVKLGDGREIVLRGAGNTVPPEKAVAKFSGRTDETRHS